MDDFDDLGPVGCAFVFIILIVIIVIMVAVGSKPEPENTPVDISIENWEPDPSIEIIDKNK